MTIPTVLEIVVKRRIALTAMLALVASMFGAVPSRAADLVLASQLSRLISCKMSGVRCRL
jgi:hypothetical protein